MGKQIKDPRDDLLPTAIIGCGILRLEERSLGWRLNNSKLDGGI